MNNNQTKPKSRSQSPNSWDAVQIGAGDVGTNGHSGDELKVTDYWPSEEVVINENEAVSA